MTTKNKKACPPMRRGSALLFATILLFVIIGVAISLSSLTVYEQRISQKNKSSVGAFFNAESGVEWAMNEIGNFSGTASNSIDNLFGAAATGADGTGADSGKMNPFPGVELYLLDENGNIIPKAQFSVVDSADLVKAVRSVGVNSKGEATQRAIEAAVAAGGGGCYVSYKTSCTGDACCLTGFTNKGDLGSWGICQCTNCGVVAATTSYFTPPGASWCAAAGWVYFGIENADLCCQ